MDRACTCVCVDYNSKSLHHRLEHNTGPMYTSIAVFIYRIFLLTTSVGHKNLMTIVLFADTGFLVYRGLTSL